MTPAHTVATANLGHGYPTTPQVKVTAVRPPGMNRQTTMSRAPNRCSAWSAQARLRAPRGPANSRRSANGANRRPRK